MKFYLGCLFLLLVGLALVRCHEGHDHAALEAMNPNHEMLNVAQETDAKLNNRAKRYGCYWGKRRKRYGCGGYGWGWGR